MLLSSLLLSPMGCDTSEDSTPSTDTGTRPTRDAGADGGGPGDAGPGDSGATDTGLPPADAGDGGHGDSGPPDAGPADSGPQEPDIQFPDLGPLDLGLTGCQLDPCPGHQVCTPDGTCSEPVRCEGDLDCIGSRICVDGVCTEPCSPGDCPGATFCHLPTGRCHEPEPCQTSRDCLPGRVCLGSVCAPAPGGGCGGGCPGGLLCGQWGICEEPRACSGDDDCLGSRVCVEGRCQDCRDDGDCPGASTCDPDGLVCVEPEACSGDDDCLGDRVCRGGTCQPLGLCEPDELEPDDTPPLLVDRVYERTLCPGERDSFRLAVPAGHGLVVTVRAQGFEPAITLSDGDREVVSTGPGEVRVAALPPAGVDVVVTGDLVARRPWQGGAYSLELSIVDRGPCPDDPGESAGGDDSRGTARDLRPGVLRARLCPGDEDWFRVPVPEDGAGFSAHLDTAGMSGEPTMTLYVGDRTIEGSDLAQENLPVGELYLRVGGGVGAYTLVVGLASPDQLQRCRGAQGASSGQAVTVSTREPANLGVGCSEAPPGAQAVVGIEVLREASLSVEVSGLSGDAMAVVEVRSICQEPGSALACLPLREGVVQVPDLPPGTYSIVVTTPAPAEVTLTPTIGEPTVGPTNDYCVDARAIPFDARGRARVSGDLLLARDTFEPAGCDQPRGLGDLFYAVELDSPSLLTARVASGQASWLTLIDDCLAPVELGCSVPGRDLMVNDLPPGRYVLVVQSEAADPQDERIVLEVERGEPVGPDRCLGALDVGEGRVFNEDTTDMVSDYNLSPHGCTGGPSTGRDMAFRVHLEEGQTLEAVLLADWDGQLYLVRDCQDAEGTCVAGVDEQPQGVEETLTWTADRDGTYYLIVDSYSISRRGPFRLWVSVDGECRVHRDCPQGFRCVAFRCREVECTVDEDCDGDGARCVDEVCVPPDCASDLDCRPRGQYCLGYECRDPAGVGWGSSMVDLAIPDGDPGGVSSVILVDEPGEVGTVQVELDIEHPYAGDLEVTLVSPAGTRVRLHNQTGGSRPFGERLYGGPRPADGPGDLDLLRGESAQGAWRLEVRDLSAGDVGTLVGWALWLSD